VSGNRHYLSRLTNSTTADIFAGGTWQPTGLSSLQTTGIIQTTYNGASSRIRTGGGAGAGGNPGTHTLTGLTVGNRFEAPLNGADLIAELILYDSALSLADLNAVGDYLADKYALTWSTAT
jgi:hypothetical protein